MHRQSQEGPGKLEPALCPKVEHVCCTGHTSWSTSGLGYLSIWLAGKLQAFNGQGNPWRLVVSLLPLTLALWIGLTRIQARQQALRRRPRLTLLMAVRGMCVRLQASY